MEINDTKKSRLKKLLGIISTPEEKQELEKLDAAKVKQIVKVFEETEADHESNYKKLEDYMAAMLGAFDMYRKNSNKYNQTIVESFGELTEKLVKKLEGLNDSVVKNKPENAAMVYKDMINAIAKVDKSIKEKPVPSWNWPQYAAVSVRNKNFANINPAISSFGIEDFDDVKLSNYDGNGNVGTVTYYLSGTIMAVLALTYDGSGNLTDAQRTQ